MSLGLHNHLAYPGRTHMQVHTSASLLDIPHLQVLYSQWIIFFMLASDKDSQEGPFVTCVPMQLGPGRQTAA